MITKVAGTVLIREVYGLSGLYIEEEIQKENSDGRRTIKKPDLSKLPKIPEAEIIPEESPEGEDLSHNPQA